MAAKKTEVVLKKILMEQGQHHITRKPIITELEKIFDKPVVSFFTSFQFPVMIDDTDADMLEGVLQKIDLSKGLILIVSSPGGDGLAAERIINICRSYSGTGEYYTLVPKKAKSAATMICFGSRKIIMGPNSELGPIDPQVAIVENGITDTFSVYNIIKSYEDLFEKAVKEKVGNLEPYLQQLGFYDPRVIEEHRASMTLSEDIAIRTLASGMMNGIAEKTIKEKIKIFLTPEHTKIHGRPIYRDEAVGCSLSIESINVKEMVWALVYELFMRTDHYVSTSVSKCIESSEHSFTSKIPSKRS
ncbi:MAG: hypothetical protein L7F77_08810 [Candidatus Magnetominusculus sp. LBB02]|nr:hypothetical protein [Candidatus Magnetominusculus sp. LBB02]